VIFVDVGEKRHELIGSRAECTRALDAYRPGPWLAAG
jgi:hypothetical protein